MKQPTPDCGKLRNVVKTNCFFLNLRHNIAVGRVLQIAENLDVLGEKKFLS